ncbi:putative inhibitor of MCP methylation, CheC [Desulfosporosinus acidiphilus SJ4]|uniref:Putative inhibitor of MCP methylation, CheC n=1 Tax=Desulfosporosinus acidiphilus (strain DSM 22704 / JCM 16185 / SJ4) TaxID=646529 RepID=I4D1J6_DESAJ|nr:chemotaxis protein CheX [Desulfosporosinus acidiphilus]AFM39670.1 putative inhibitor of MCP methylation, CheC [Desulfosporosinus acidiphilus SJ4]
MDINLINPLILSFTEVLPQIGFQSVERRGLSLIGSTLDYDGVLVNISLVGALKGAVLIGMSLDSAKQFASKMMMGMPVTDFDSLAQSAISEMGNMVCANTCTQFSKVGINGLDISPPVLLIGHNGQATLPVPQTIAVQFDVDGIPIDIYVGLIESK